MRLAQRLSLSIIIPATLLMLIPDKVLAQSDGGVDVEADGGGQEVLQSLFIPPIAHAPFSLTLSTEWSRPINGGGNFTIVNIRPIKRDSAGRIYQERWLLAPKNSEIRSTMSWIQIADPIAKTLLQCEVPKRICELDAWTGSPNLRYSPALKKSGPLPNGKGYETHEDLGVENVQGVPVHGYRDTTTLNAWVFGNDQPMSTVREFRYSEELGINLLSVLEAPRLGRQTFSVTEITMSEPDPSFFRPPAGFRVVDNRKSKPAP